MYETEILKIYQKCHIQRYPIDCFWVMNCMSFRLIMYSSLIEMNEELSFLRSNSCDAVTLIDTNEIFYNDRKDRRRIRFTLMHELGHIVLDTQNEDEADAFAAEILAPLSVAVWKNLRTADSISRYFDVSISAANRLVSKINNRTKVDSDVLVRYFAESKEPKKKVKTQKEINFKPLLHEDKFRKYAEQDSALREKYGIEKYWDMVLDRIENERLWY